MSVQIIGTPSRGCDFQFCHFGEIVLVVETISKDVAKVAQRSLETIRDGLFLCLFKGRGFAFAILDMAIANVLRRVSRTADWHQSTDFVVCAILQRDTDYARQSKGNLASRWRLVDLPI